MIICSCNVFDDTKIRAVVANSTQRPRMSRIYAALGCSAKCGRCAQTIKSLVEELRPIIACGRRPRCASDISCGESKESSLEKVETRM